MIHARDIHKRFAAVEVLRGVSLDVGKGEVVAILEELENKNKRNAQGKIRVRPAREDMKARAVKARAAKGKKK